VGLLVHGDHGSLSHEGFILALDLSIDHLLVVLLKPFSLHLQLLLELDVSLAVLVNILKKVGAGLVFTPPLSFTSIPLLLVLLSDEVFDHSLVFLLVLSALLVELLESHDLFTSSESFLLLELLDGLFSLKSSGEHVLVAGFLSFESSLMEGTLSFVVGDEVLVALSVESEHLLLHVLLLSSFNSPLLFKHSLLLFSQFSFLLTLDLSGVSLPVADSHSILNQGLLGLSLLDLTVSLLLSVKLPEFSVDHLFFHLLLELSSLINELLLALDLGTMSVELLIFFAELIGGGLKSLVHASLHLSPAFFFTLALQVV